MYNILSLLLGIAAIIFSIHSLQVRGCLICCTFSGLCCSLSLLLQLADTDLYAQGMDAAAIYDTAHARVIAGIILLTIVTILNILAMLRGRKQDCDHC